MAKEQGWDIEAALNNDIVGGDRSPQQNPGIVRVFSEGVPLAATEAEVRRIRNLGGENDSASRQLARYIAEVEPDLPDRSQAAARVSPGPLSARRRPLFFQRTGVMPAVRFTEYREDYNHQHQNVRTENGIEYGDVPKFVNFDYVANVARVNAATLASLASSPAPPAKVRLQTKQLENDSTLTWEASPGAASYEVLWRDTASPEWEHAKSIGNVTRATLPLSKDNVIFAVRALDAAGHRSLPVVPQPER